VTDCHPLNLQEMKSLSIILALSLCGSSVSAQVVGARLQASGLTCAMCARSVYKNLESLSFVDSVDTDLEQSAFVLTFKDGSTVDADQIRKRVEDAGFSVAGLELKAKLPSGIRGNDGHLTLSGRTYHILTGSGPGIEGEASLRVVDKSFLSSKEERKYAGMSTAACFRTGHSGGKCCEASGIPAGQRVYHLSL
jgi:copper chaperone CopZ